MFKTSQLVFNPRVRKSPFFLSTMKHGASAFTIYNHMYLPISYEGVIEDYNKGLLAKDCIVAILDIAAKHNLPVYVDPKRDNFFIYNKIRLFKPNMFEFDSMINLDKQNKNFEELGKQLREKIDYFFYVEFFSWSLDYVLI